MKYKFSQTRHHLRWFWSLSQEVKVQRSRSHNAASFERLLMCMWI